jgi:hypothetical protein
VTAPARDIALLKQDLFGVVRLVELPDGSRRVVRDLRAARPGLRWLAHHLAKRERRALQRLAGLPGVPRLEHADGDGLVREWIEGEPMHLSHPRDARYFRAAFALLRRLHRRNVAHNDLAKEPNWLVTPSGEPALVDFQLALCSRRRGGLFRALAHDDLRHLLKHKRTYLPQRLTARERRILERPSLVSRIWMASGKKLYLFVTRRLLGWSDREGAGDRGLPS